MSKSILHVPPPSEQVYQAHLPGRYAGFTIEDYFHDRFPYLSREEWCDKIEAGHITVNGLTVELGTCLNDHDFIVTRMGMKEEPPADRSVRVLFEDEHIRAYNKGAPLPIHPSGRYYQNSMTEILKARYPDETPRPVQRLDALTTGVVVFARSREAARYLMHEFTQDRVRKVYLALVEGCPREKRFTIDAPVGKVKGSARGVGAHLPHAKPAVTEVQWLASVKGRSLLRVMPRTGRTNQIRVHLAHVGLPLVNDPVYGQPASPEYEFGLHAFRLEFQCFDHPLELEAPWPDHFQPFVELADWESGGGP